MMVAYSMIITKRCVLRVMQHPLSKPGWGTNPAHWISQVQDIWEFAELSLCIETYPGAPETEDNTLYPYNSHTTSQNHHHHHYHNVYVCQNQGWANFFFTVGVALDFHCNQRLELEQIGAPVSQEAEQVVQ